MTVDKHGFITGFKPSIDYLGWRLHILGNTILYMLTTPDGFKEWFTPNAIGRVTIPKDQDEIQLPLAIAIFDAIGADSRKLVSVISIIKEDENE